MEQTQATELQTAASFQPQMSSGVVKFMKDCISGTVGGIAVVAVGHPFGTTCEYSVAYGSAQWLGI